MSVLLAWLVIGAALIVGELLTGTIYLLIFGLAAWAGAAATYFGYDFHLQLATTGIVALAALALFVPYDVRRRRREDERAAPDLDIGNDVRVETVIDETRAKVHYRGSAWDALVEPDTRGLAAGAICVIAAVHGNTLVVRRATR